MMLLPYIPASRHVIMTDLLPASLRHVSSDMMGTTNATAMHSAHAAAAVMPADAHSSGAGGPSRSLPLMSVLAWALATPVQFGFGSRFLTG
jgi:hypothetical protein